MKLEFFFDYSSPWAYLGSTQIERVAEDANAELVLKPFLLGALFRTIGTPMVPLHEFSQAKQQYLARDLYRWARLWDVPFQWPTRFPMRTVTALRLTLNAGERAVPLMHRLFRAAWVEDADLNDTQVMTDLANEVGLPTGAVDATQEAEAKATLKTATDEAANRGVCGVPTYGVGNDLFWGQDRLVFVEKALRGWTLSPERQASLGLDAE